MTILVAVAFATAGLDALTKQLVVVRLVEDRLYGVGAGAGWGVRRVHNERGAYAGLPVSCTALLWIAITAAVAAAVASTAVALPGLVGLGMAVGGAAGNVADRMFRGAVVDFVAAGPWPVFNLADAAMVVGLTMAAVSVL